MSAAPEQGESEAVPEQGESAAPPASNSELSSTDERPVEADELGAARRALRTELLSECMSTEGFEYFDTEIFFPDIDPAQSLFLDEADVIGYGVLVDAARVQLGQAAVLEMAESLQEPLSAEYYEALLGSSTTHQHEGNEETHSHDAQDGGCEGEATRLLTELSGKPSHEQFADGFEVIADQFEALPSYSEQVSIWASCMAAEGFATSTSPFTQLDDLLADSYELVASDQIETSAWQTQNAELPAILDRIAASPDLSSALQLEIDMAIADRECRQEFADFAVENLNALAVSAGIAPLYGAN